MKKGYSHAQELFTFACTEKVGSGYEGGGVFLGFVLIFQLGRQGMASDFEKTLS